MSLDRLIQALDAIEIFAFIRPAGPKHPGGGRALLVVVPDGIAEDRLKAAAAADIVPCRVGWFERTRGRPGTVAHAAATGGRRLYPR